VQARANIGEYPHAIVVPERAVMEGQTGSSVYVVDAHDRIGVVNVKAVDTYQGLRVIESGLEAGQQVVVEGFQLVRPGMTVKATETTVELPAEGDEKKESSAPTGSKPRGNSCGHWSSVPDRGQTGRAGAPLGSSARRPWRLALYRALARA